MADLLPVRVPSERQIEANSQNGRLGGPNTDEGKAVCRLNARTHGIFASALTEQDQEELHGVHDAMAGDLQPLGALEEALVEKLAVTYVRLQRCARAEAEYHRAAWERRRGKRRLQLGPRSTFKPCHFSHTVELVHRYDTSLTNQFVRLVHELERLQRRRKGEAVAAPVTADVSVSGQ